MKIMILNGPSLNLLGTREPEVYGTTTLDEIASMCTERGRALGLDVDFRQTNDEAQLIGWLHEARESAAGIVMNPAAFTHYSLAVRDAVSALGLPAVEVHLSNIYGREEWRAKSVVSGVVTGVIAGFGPTGYLLALEALAQVLGQGEGDAP